MSLLGPKHVYRHFTVASSIACIRFHEPIFSISRSQMNVRTNIAATFCTKLNGGGAVVSSLTRPLRCGFTLHRSFTLSWGVFLNSVFTDHCQIWESWKPKRGWECHCMTLRGGAPMWWAISGVRRTPDDCSRELAVRSNPRSDERDPVCGGPTMTWWEY